MVNIPKDLEKVLKKEVAAAYKSKGEDVSAAIKAVFQNLTENDITLGKKAQAARDSMGAAFAPVFNALLSFAVLCHSERTTPDEVEAKLIEMQLDNGLVQVFTQSYTKFVEYLDSAESLSDEPLCAQFQLLDFRWEMRENLFDTDAEIPKSNMVIGEFLYLQSWTGHLKRFRCLVPYELTEQIARETDIALSAFKNFKETFN